MPASFDALRHGVAMRRRNLLLFTVSVACTIAAAGSPNASAAARGTWTMPIDGTVHKRFDYRRTRPFQTGARRNIVISGRRGERVRSTCSGKVTYAGPVPGHENGVTVICGDLVATHLGLMAPTTAVAGQAVQAGGALGRLAETALTLGARYRDDRWGYVDPLELIGTQAPGLGPAPVSHPRRGRPATRTPASDLRFARPAMAPTAPAVPVTAWIGLGIAAMAFGGVALTPAGSLRRRWAPSTSRRRSTTSTPLHTSDTRMR
ncbi:MAG TPA: hypothetical protein VNT22_05485 [Baekduia sp.]|nr:hypothetical protein [Baekduia sp.]